MGKPLRIGGVAITAGLSRNLNVYTAEELQAFASQLVGAPMYIEHVSVSNATGKVTKAFYDSVSRCLMYEAEVYDPVTADKIRNGLIQHVSVGADYTALDLVDAKVPHGLHNAELSLVAVPGIPEANIQVLERLRESLGHKAGGAGHVKLKLSVKEALGETDVFCIFCDNPADYFVSICQPCVDKFSLPAGGSTPSVVLESLKHLPVREVNLFVREAAGDLPSDFTAFKMRFQALGSNPCARCDALDGKEFIYGTEPELPLHPNCQCSYQMVERLHVHFNGVEKLEEKELENLAEKVAAKVGEKSSLEVEKLKASVAEAQAKVADVEGKLKTVEEAKADAVGKLGTANKTIEDLRKQLPGGGLLVNPPKVMLVSEHVEVLEGLLPPVVVERSTMGMQRQGQAIRSAILQAKEKLGAK